MSDQGKSAEQPDLDIVIVRDQDMTPDGGPPGGEWRFFALDGQGGTVPSFELP